MSYIEKHYNHEQHHANPLKSFTKERGDFEQVVKQVESSSKKVGQV